jgi:hypothetical protein
MRSDVKKRNGHRNRPQKRRDKMRTEAGHRNDSPVVIAIRIHVQQMRRAARSLSDRVDHGAISPLGKVWN